MFRLHDRTRRHLCIAGFFLLCVTPTVLVTGWCVTRHLPGHAAAEARRLRRELGFDVSLDGMEYLRPGVVLYEGLELRDPETGEVILRCRSLEAGRVETGNDKTGPGESYVLVASQPEVEAAALDRVGELVTRLLRRRAGDAELDVRLRAGELTLQAPTGSQTLTDLAGSIESTAEVAQADVEFRLAGDRRAGDERSEPIRIRLARNRKTTPAITGFDLNTGGRALPCSVLAMGLPLLRSLGPESRFDGYVWSNEMLGDPSDEAAASGRYNGDVVRGRLLGVDLDRLVSDRFPHKLSGTADVTIESAEFGDGRLESASGTLVAGPGVISRSLIQAAAVHLHLAPGANSPTPGDLVPYEQLAFEFVFDKQGLTLNGRCTGGDPGALLIDGERVLLGKAPQGAQSTIGLLRTLLPPSELQVPAGRQTGWLIRHLPVPQIVPAKGAAPPSSGGLRFGGAVQ
ncbi:MAG: hypothetical protein HQ567_13240 [Candidatus Nealsonbacteria bacterium]|nr:hypothetical protein [Candidatus Nealsonbacteria bacterium]